MRLGHPTYLVDYGEISFSDRQLGLEHWANDVIPGAIESVSEDTGGAIQEGGPSVSVYFDVDDAQAARSRVQELGGSADEAMPVPGMGWFVTCTDPEGNAFGLWQTDPNAQMPGQ